MINTKKILWQTQKPSYHQKTVMLKKCGRKCFLGTKQSFPICKKNTCSVIKEGIIAAYKRAKEYITISKNKRKNSNKYSRIANRAKRMM